MGKILFLLLFLAGSFASAQTCSDLFYLSTTDYYNSHALEYNETRAHVSPELKKQIKNFLGQLPERGKILEIGSGHGRDALFFKQKGYKVVATEPSDELAKLAEEKIRQPVMRIKAQEINFKNEFDGVWAMASLIHVPVEELPGVFIKIRDSLKDGGTVHASFLKGVGTPDVAETIEDGRFFNRVSEGTLRKIIKDIGGFEIDGALTTGQKDDYFGKNAPSQEFGFFNLVLTKKTPSDLEVYSDGGYKKSRGTWAYVIVKDGEILKEGSGRSRSGDNNGMEFQAAIEALKVIPPGKHVTFYSDSRNLIDTMKGLIRPGKLIHQILILESLQKDKTITWKWIKGHSGIPYNERCDTLCTQARK